jgi:hypothetical protein
LQSGLLSTIDPILVPRLKYVVKAGLGIGALFRWTRLIKGAIRNPTLGAFSKVVYKHALLQSKIKKLGGTLDIDFFDINFGDWDIDSPLIRGELDRIQTEYPELYDKITNVNREDLGEILSVTEMVADYSVAELEHLNNIAPNLFKSVTVMGAMPIITPALDFLETPHVPERFLISQDLWVQDAWNYLVSGGEATVSSFLDDVLFFLPGWGTFTYVTSLFLSYADKASDVIYKVADVGYEILIELCQVLRQAREYAEYSIDEVISTLDSYIKEYAPVVSQFIDINVLINLLDEVDLAADSAAEDVNLVIDQAIYDAQIRYVEEVVRPTMSVSATTDIASGVSTGAATGLVIGTGVSIVSLFLAPFTFGASLLIGVGVGAAVGLGAGLIEAGSKLNEYNRMKEDLGERPV